MLLAFIADVLQCKAKLKQTLLMLHTAFDALSLHKIAEDKNLSLI